MSRYHSLVVALTMKVSYLVIILCLLTLTSGKERNDSVSTFKSFVRNELVHNADGILTKSGKNNQTLSKSHSDVPSSSTFTGIFDAIFGSILSKSKLLASPTSSSSSGSKRKLYKINTPLPSVRPSSQPTGQPTRMPLRSPSGQPTAHPTRQPTSRPSRFPTAQPSAVPSSCPSSKPSGPTSMPSSIPSTRPSSHPSSRPTFQPTTSSPLPPGVKRTRRPTPKPTLFPSLPPTSMPTSTPTLGITSRLQYYHASNTIHFLSTISSSTSYTLYSDASLSDQFANVYSIVGGCYSYDVFLQNDLTLTFATKSIQSLQLSMFISVRESPTFTQSDIFCTDPTTSALIVSNLISKTPFSITCPDQYGHIFEIKTCQQGVCVMPALCIDCPNDKDVCSRKDARCDVATYDARMIPQPRQTTYDAPDTSPPYDPVVMSPCQMSTSTTTDPQACLFSPSTTTATATSTCPTYPQSLKNVPYVYYPSSFSRIFAVYFNDGGIPTSSGVPRYVSASTVVQDLFIDGIAITDDNNNNNNNREDFGTLNMVVGVTYCKAYNNYLDDPAGFGAANAPSNLNSYINYIVPLGIDEIIATGFSSLLDYSTTHGVLRIPGLSPLSQYCIYCATVTYTGQKPTIQQTSSRLLSPQTKLYDGTIRKNVTVRILSPTLVTPAINAFNLYTPIPVAYLTVDQNPDPLDPSIIAEAQQSSPPAPLPISLKLTVTATRVRNDPILPLLPASCRTAATIKAGLKGYFAPPSISLDSFSDESQRKIVVYVVFSSGGGVCDPGNYKLRVTATGLSIDEYNIVYAIGSGVGSGGDIGGNFTVIPPPLINATSFSAWNKMSSMGVGQFASPPPQLIDAIFSLDGTHIKILFDVPTNRGGMPIVFSCKSIFSFQGDAFSTCEWVDNANVVIYTSLSEAAADADAASLSEQTSTSTTSSSAMNSTIHILSTALLALASRIPQPGGTIRLLPFSIKQQCPQGYACDDSWQYSDPTTVIIRTPSPIDCIVPRVSISAPSFLGNCDSFVMDLSASTGSGGRDWDEVTINVYLRNSNTPESATAAAAAAEATAAAGGDRTISSVSTAGTAVATDIMDYISSHYSIYTAPITVPASLLVPGNTYNFVVTLCNFLHSCGSTSHTVYVWSASVPSIIIPGPRVRRLKNNMPLSITTSATISTCDGSNSNKDTNFFTYYYGGLLPSTNSNVYTVSTGLTYSWSVYASGTDNTKQPSPVLSLVSTATDPTQFSLPAFSLTPARLYQVHVKVVSTSTARASEEVISIYVDQGNFVVVIADQNGNTGREMFLKRKDTLTLSIGQSYDEELEGGELPCIIPYQLIWRCEQLTPLYIPNCLSFMAAKGRQNFQFAGNFTVKNSVLSLTYTTLNGRSILRVTATLSELGVMHPRVPRSSSAQVMIYAIDSPKSPAIVARVTSTAKKVPVSPGDKLQFSGAVSPFSPMNSITATWSINDDYNNVYLSQILRSPQISSTALISPASINLVVAGINLPRSQSSLVFTLTTFNANTSASALASTSTSTSTSSGMFFPSTSLYVRVNSPPKGGMLGVTPSTGREMLDYFKYFTSLWEDEELPLTYSFGYYNPASSTSTWGGGVAAIIMCQFLSFREVKFHTELPSFPLDYLRINIG